MKDFVMQYPGRCGALVLALIALIAINLPGEPTRSLLDTPPPAAVLEPPPPASAPTVAVVPVVAEVAEIVDVDRVDCYDISCPTAATWIVVPSAPMTSVERYILTLTACTRHAAMLSGQFRTLEVRFRLIPLDE